MKKSILLVACVTLLTVGAISVSCSKDDDWKGCRCTFTYADGGQGTHTESAAELKEHGINSCAEYKEWTEEDSYLSNVRCSDL